MEVIVAVFIRNRTENGRHIGLAMVTVESLAARTLKRMMAGSFIHLTPPLLRLLRFGGDGSGVS